MTVSKKNTRDRSRKIPASAPGEVFWKRGYVLLCVILLCLTAVQLCSFVLSDPRSGWDYRVYAATVQSINKGEDPYLLPTISQYTGESIPFNYAPHSLLFLWCLQFFYLFQSIWIYYAFLVPFLIASGYIIINLDQKPQYLFFITLAVTGFMGTFWNFITGNKEILFLFLFAVIFYLLVQEKFWQSSIVLGFMGSFTLVTLPFTALYLVIHRPIVQRVQYIFLSIGVVAAIFLITWLINPVLFASYSTTFQGSTSALNEPSGKSTPTPFLLFGVLVNQTNGISIPLILVSLAYICFILGASWYAIRKNQENALKVYSLAMLAIFMLLPRIKPYYFIVLAIPLYFLFKDCRYKIKILVLTVISLLPLFLWYFQSFSRYYPEIYQRGPIPYLIAEYAQTVSLFLIFALTIALEYYRPVSPSSHS
jgi:hypothetical protein